MRRTGDAGIVVDCPACGLPLPPVPVEFDARADGPRTLTVRVQPRLDGAWWEQVRMTHPGCAPDRAP